MCRRRLDARRGPWSAVPVRSQAVGTQPAPQGRPADAEAPRGLGELALRHFERVEDGLALALRQRGTVFPVRQEHHLTQLDRTLFQGSSPAAEADEPITQV